VEAELSDQLKDATAHREDRTKAERLFNSYQPDVKVKVEDGKFSKLIGPETDLGQLEVDLIQMFGLSDNVHDRSPHMVNGCDQISMEKQQRGFASVNDQIPLEKHLPLQHERAVHSPSHGSLHGPEPGIRIPGSLGEKDLNGSDVRSPISGLFSDEMDVEKHVYNYLIFKQGDIFQPGAILSNYNCSFGLKRGGVDTTDRRQYRLQVCFYFAPENGAKYCIGCLSVCLSVSLSDCLFLCLLA